MAFEWIVVNGSSRIVAEGYDPEWETIYVRFPNGIEWQYHACPPQVWEAFTAPGQSRGQYISQVLNFKPNSRYDG
jgi:KTSC domain